MENYSFTRYHNFIYQVIISLNNSHHMMLLSGITAWWTICESVKFVVSSKVKPEKLDERIRKK
jgi:hypothetical protein